VVSISGLILLIIFINDIDSVCHGQTNMKLFADDAKLYSEIDLNACSLSLQTSLKNLVGLLPGNCLLMFKNVVFCLL